MADLYKELGNLIVDTMNDFLCGAERNRHSARPVAERGFF